MYYKLHCEICGYTIVTDGTNLKLTEYIRSKVQKEIPKLDSNEKLVPGTWLSLPKKYKCPKCGRLISPRKHNENQAKGDNDKNINPGSQGGIERL